MWELDQWMNLALEQQTQFVVKKKKKSSYQFISSKDDMKRTELQGKNQCGAHVFLSGHGLNVPEQVECHGEGAL